MSSWDLNYNKKRWISTTDKGGWIGVVEQLKRSHNKNYLTLEFLNVYKLIFQQLFNKAYNSQESMNATTLSQQFINVSHMQILQHSSKLIHKNNYLLNSFQFTIWYHQPKWTKKTYSEYPIDNHTYFSSHFFYLAYILK